MMGDLTVPHTSPYRKDIPERPGSINHSYFYMPPIWVGSQPTDAELATPTNELIKVVCSRTLAVGISLSVHRDGVFLFDFQQWPDGCPVSIPAHTIEGGKPLPSHIQEAERKAEHHRYNCMAVMNAHLACMSTAMSKVQGHGLWIKQVITPSSYFTTHWVNGQRHIVGVTAQSDPILAYVSTNLPLDIDISEKRARAATIKLDTIEHSLNLLEQILTNETPDTLLMTTLIYFSAINYAQHDFPTALTLAWSVCEKLLRTLWDKYLIDRTFLADDNGVSIKVINSDRKKLLSGTDYTASVISEVLALAGRLRHNTYLGLSKARKARNGWLHNLTPISSMVARECIQTAQTLLKEVTSIDLAVNLSHSSRL